MPTFTFTIFGEGSNEDIAAIINAASAPGYVLTASVEDNQATGSNSTRALSNEAVTVTTKLDKFWKPSTEERKSWLGSRARNAHDRQTKRKTAYATTSFSV
ncbi:hypothetical protein CONLIGDRAFT_686643 [Coniochaeta ligniaria NRRL 30616]|uniref:Uncharacterized protein n=1 Tax=Coniochaeta ligniaria NRRL 30616 TaxID=1408157 RepID=A0A1J7I8N2_9PEZI|nr:hypothetical protein CONLIGDRAFT_686643 [Coniochaeta ligniaria NRRL 30616]